MDNEAVTRGKIFKGLVFSSIAAGVVTVLFIMPAEYGRDITGVGNALGLTRLGVVPEVDPVPLLMEGGFPAIVEDFDEYEPPVIGQPFGSTKDTPFNSETFSITLEPGEQVEYKAVMQQGDMLVFSWTSNAPEIYSDFHADPIRGDGDNYPKDYYVRYAESEAPQGHGSIVAPFAGNHGWYWLNYNEEAIEIELNVSGYYSEINELFRSFQY